MALLSTADEKATPALDGVRISYNRMHDVTVFSPSEGEAVLGDLQHILGVIDPDGDMMATTFCSAGTGAFPILSRWHPAFRRIFSSGTPLRSLPGPRTA